MFIAISEPAAFVCLQQTTRLCVSEKRQVKGYLPTCRSNLHVGIRESLYVPTQVGPVCMQVLYVCITKKIDKMKLFLQHRLTIPCLLTCCQQLAYIQLASLRACKYIHQQVATYLPVITYRPRQVPTYLHVDRIPTCLFRQVAYLISLQYNNLPYIYLFIYIHSFLPYRSLM